jgi:transposase
MLIPYENKQIFMATKPSDFRMSIDGLSNFIQNELKTHLHDGSIYVFYNKNLDKIKCLFWDRNGFVLYYKRLDKCKFKMKKMLKNIEMITASELETLLSGFAPEEPLIKSRKPRLLEHKA